VGSRDCSASMRALVMVVLPDPLSPVKNTAKPRFSRGGDTSCSHQPKRQTRSTHSQRLDRCGPCEYIGAMAPSACVPPPLPKGCTTPQTINITAMGSHDHDRGTQHNKQQTANNKLHRTQVTNASGHPTPPLKHTPLSHQRQQQEQEQEHRVEGTEN
jgi:hypothetical protein